MIRPSRAPLPPSGQLEGIAAPELVCELAHRRATGLLHVTRCAVRRTLHLDEGRVVFASSSNPDDRLGEHLLKGGKITVSQLETALAEQTGDERLGTLLVSAGILTADELSAAVTEQVRAIGVGLLGLADGEYRFDEGPLPTQENITLDLSMPDLLMHGVRAIHSSRLIQQGVGTPRTVVRLADEWGRSAEELTLTEGSRQLIDRLAEGPASVATLCRELCLSSYEVFQTLWVLRLIGVIEPCARRSGGAGHEGNLGETTLAELLIRLEAAGETGVLYLTRGLVERGIFFAAGRCVFATSNDPDDGLLNFLFRRGVISLRDKEETVRRLLSNKRVGTILRELGAIDDADLQQMVREQVGEIIWDTFAWEDGEFVFVPDSLPHAEEITLDTAVAGLVAEGARRVRSWTRLVRGCGGIDHPLCLTPRYLAVLDAMGAGVVEWEIVNALKSPQTPRRVCAVVDQDDHRVFQILWCLRLLGAVEDSPVELGDLDDDEVPPAEPAAQDRGEVHEVVAALHALGGEPPPQDGEASAAPAPEEVWQPPADVDEVIARFNALHRIVYRAVRAEVGAGATNFVRSCCDEIAKDLPDAVAGVELNNDGSWDAPGLKRALIERRIDDPWTVYQRVLDQEFVSLQPHLGNARANELRERVWASAADQSPRVASKESVS